jgi:hypothetical protein
MLLRSRSSTFPRPADRHRAVTSFREPFCLDSKGMVKSRPIVFPCQRCRQLHQLRVRELGPQLPKQRVTHFYWRLGHRVGVFQNQFLRIGKQRTRCVIPKCFDLFL